MFFMMIFSFEFDSCRIEAPIDRIDILSRSYSHKLLQ